MIHNKGETLAYKNEAGKKIYVSHRGTKGLNKSDLSADVAIALGLEKYHPRFKRAKQLQQRLEKENPGYSFITTGHSLGGSLAQYTGKSKKVGKVVTFNKGSGLFEPYRQRASKQTDYIHAFDPVSYFSQSQRGGKLKISRKLKLNPHSL